MHPPTPPRALRALLVLPFLLAVLPAQEHTAGHAGHAMAPAQGRAWQPLSLEAAAGTFRPPVAGWQHGGDVDPEGPKVRPGQGILLAAEEATPLLVAAPLAADLELRLECWLSDGAALDVAPDGSHGITLSTAAGVAAGEWLPLRVEFHAAGDGAPARLAHARLGDVVVADARAADALDALPLSPEPRLTLRARNGALAIRGLAWRALPPMPEPPADFGPVDRHLRLGVRPGLLRYDREQLHVAPGERVALTLVNDDEMFHNLVLCAPGERSTEQVAMATLALGAAMADRQYVPDHPAVRGHTRMLAAGERDTLYFVAPAEPTTLPYVCTFPGHHMTMKGVVLVSDEAPGLGPVGYRVYHGSWKELPDYDALPPVATGKADDLGIGVADRKQNFGMVFEAPLHVLTPGRYVFRIDGDDGVRLKIDGAVVAERDGTHPPGSPASGEVELKTGTHALRVEYFQAGGGRSLYLEWTGPGQPTAALGTAAMPGRAAAKAVPLAIGEQPRLIRAFLPDTGTRSVAVGLPGGMNLCLDTETLGAPYGWIGGFLDVGPDRLARGGKVVRPLGLRRDLGGTGCPLRLGSGDEPPTVHLLEMRPRPVPTFRFAVDERVVTLTVRADPRALSWTLRYAFETAPPGPVRWEIEHPEAVEATSDVGTWSRPGVLAVPAGVRAFEVTLKAREGSAEDQR